MILDKFPEIDDFYQKYWGKQPFVVRGAIEEDVFDGLIDGDTLAGLALEEGVRSRLMITQRDKKSSDVTWQCEHGPFAEDRFSSLGDKDWSLLVQNVEQYHVETSALLKSFNFTPRWLMDDIMISYSAEGGSVGPHTDSYHVFLVQGQGSRRWKVGTKPLSEDQLVNSNGHLILKDGFEGESFDVTMGDVIYIPPLFAHEGVTLEEAMTFSVGFLGPKMSELLVEYGQYLEQQDNAINPRYIGRDLDANSAGRNLCDDCVSGLQNSMRDALGVDEFSKWLVHYFSLPTHVGREDMYDREDVLEEEEMQRTLEAGSTLYCAEYTKVATTKASSTSRYVAVYGDGIEVGEAQSRLIEYLEQKRVLSYASIEGLGGWALLGAFVTGLYNKQYLDMNK